MLSLPTARVEVVHVATSVPLNATLVQPVIAVPLAVNDTVPVGVPVVGATGATVAVKVTD
jgi:hypothetical protein